MFVYTPSHWFGVGALQPVRVPGDGPVQHGDHAEVTEGAAASLVMEKKKKKSTSIYLQIHIPAGLI